MLVNITVNMFLSGEIASNILSAITIPQQFFSEDYHYRKTIATLHFLYTYKNYPSQPS